MGRTSPIVGLICRQKLRHGPTLLLKPGADFEIIRTCPLQLHAHMVGDLATVVCVNLQGETVSELAGFDLEESGFGVAARIAEQVPAPEGIRWKLVLPSCQFLAGGHLESPLRDLFELSQAGA